MTLTHVDYLRKVYGTLDLMADLGGLFAAIKTPFIIILGFTNFYASYQFVMADNFVHKDLPPK